MICFYHRADLDGRCSGAIVMRAHPDCEMIGFDYGEPFPWERLERRPAVVMVDLSLQPFEQMVQLASSCDLTWIDHHKSAIEDYQRCGVRFPCRVLDTNFAACELAWGYFFPNDTMPEAVQLLGRYDIWKHEDTPGALEFQYGMRLRDKTDPADQIWVELFGADDPEGLVRQIIKDGKTALKYQRQRDAAFARAYAFETELDGLRCIAVNKGMTNSLVFESVYDPEKHDAMMPFAWTGGSWTVSLYSTKPEVDVSAVAKARGGGGHRGAAGFQCDELPFPLPRRGQTP